jgi:hypothetical protein
MPYFGDLAEPSRSRPLKNFANCQKRRNVYYLLFMGLNKVKRDYFGIYSLVAHAVRNLYDVILKSPKKTRKRCLS